jgi:hypothetical protein
MSPKGRVAPSNLAEFAALQESPFGPPRRLTAAVVRGRVGWLVTPTLMPYYLGRLTIAAAGGMVNQTCLGGHCRNPV